MQSINLHDHIVYYDYWTTSKKNDSIVVKWGSCSLEFWDWWYIHSRKSDAWSYLNCLSKNMKKSVYNQIFVKFPLKKQLNSYKIIEIYTFPSTLLCQFTIYVIMNMWRAKDRYMAWCENIKLQHPYHKASVWACHESNV